MFVLLFVVLGFCSSNRSRIGRVKLSKELVEDRGETGR